MRIHTVLLVGFAVTSIIFAENKSKRIAKVGVLPIHSTAGKTTLAQNTTNDIIHYLKSMEVYTVVAPQDIAKSVEYAGKRVPAVCRDPQCVIAIGKMVECDRIIYGSIDEFGNKIGIRLSEVDVAVGEVTNEVGVQGDAGVGVREVVNVALARLYKQERGEEKSVQTYYGPPVHNEKQFLISAASFITAGLVWGLVNYSIEHNDVPELTATYTDEKLTGIPSSADQIPLFARPSALANAYVAASDDAYGVLYNPAGVAWVAGAEGVLGYQYRFGVDNFAASYVNKATRQLGYGHAILYSGDRDLMLTEMYFVSALAYKFQSLPVFDSPLSLGLNLKLVSNRVQGSSPDSPSGSSLGGGIDLGLRCALSEKIHYGLLLKDVPVVNRWKNIATDHIYYETHAATLRMGGTFRAGYSTFLIAEGQIPLYNDQGWKMAGGIEQEFFRVIYARAGIQKEIQSNYQTPWIITSGFGLTIPTTAFFGNFLTLDGSYEYNTLQVFDVFNLSLRFAF